VSPFSCEASQSAYEMITALGLPLFMMIVGSCPKCAASTRLESLSRSSRVPIRFISIAKWYAVYMTAGQAKRQRYIYVVGCAGVQVVKIGAATNCAERLSWLQIGCPFPLALLWSWPAPDAAAAEKALHAQFSQHRVRGEWFDLGPDPVPRVKAALAAEIRRPLPVRRVVRLPGTNLELSAADRVTRVLISADHPLTAQEVASAAGVSYGHARVLLHRLTRRGVTASPERGLYAVLTAEN
jgi:hypothetical protein